MTVWSDLIDVADWNIRDITHLHGVGTLNTIRMIMTQPDGRRLTYEPDPPGARHRFANCYDRDDNQLPGYLTEHFDMANRLSHKGSSGAAFCLFVRLRAMP